MEKGVPLAALFVCVMRDFSRKIVQIFEKIWRCAGGLVQWKRIADRQSFQAWIDGARVTV